jgi:hypothetical protein
VSAILIPTMNREKRIRFHFTRTRIVII